MESALLEHLWMGVPKRDRGALAEMPSVSGRESCSFDGSRIIDYNRDVSALGSPDSVCSFTVIRVREPHGSLQTRGIAFQTREGEMQHEVVSREEWIQARTALLAKEKELTHLRDELSRQRLKLPWVKVEKEYVFDAPNGKVTLSDLFDGRSQLFIKHFMLGPGQAEQCVGCSFEVDHIEGVLIHLQNHDVTYAVVARAPIEEIETMRQRMGWRFRWVSSYHSDFNYDFNVSFTPEQIAEGRAFYNYRYENPGLEDRSGDSVFFKDESGQIFHTYSTFGRGGEEFLGAYRILDVLPKGRNENGPYHTLADWVRPKNAYGENGIVEANGRYHVHGCGCAVHK
jgi:predicted dithiol-disulfide oxidoreductase (DUF899 family)